MGGGGGTVEELEVERSDTSHPQTYWYSMYDLNLLSLCNHGSRGVEGKRGSGIINNYSTRQH